MLLKQAAKPHTQHLDTYSRAHLHAGKASPGNEGMKEGPSLEAGGEHINILVVLNGFLLCEADCGNGRRTEDGACDRVVVGLRVLLLAKRLLCKRHALQRNEVSYDIRERERKWERVRVRVRVPSARQTPAQTGFMTSI